LRCWLLVICCLGIYLSMIYCGFIYFHLCQFSWIDRNWNVRWRINFVVLTLANDFSGHLYLCCALNFMVWLNQRKTWKLVFNE
jgi:hypothetical protein